MADLHILSSLTDTDKKHLLQNLKAKKKDFQFELIIYVAIWLVAPLLTHRPGQKPLIESMSYGMALFFFGLGFLIPLSFSYFGKIHKAVLSCRTGLKRVIVTQVVGKKQNPIFHKEEYCLKLADKYVKKLYFPKRQFNQFQIGDNVRIELSENGRQVIKITKATQTLIERIQKKETELPANFKKPYSSVLFGKETENEVSYKAVYSFFIPAEQRFVSTIILDINLLVFLIMLLSGVSIYKPLVIDIIHWGGNIKRLTIEQQQYWRLVTNIFVHIGIVHLLMNTLGFIFVASFIERKVGRIWFAGLYMVTGICASVTSVMWHNDTVSAGASGAIFGLYGFFLAILMVKKEHRQVNSGMITMTLIFIGYNLLMGLKGNIDNAAHIGGLLSGFLIGVVMSFSKLLSTDRGKTTYSSSIAASGADE